MIDLFLKYWNTYFPNLPAFYIYCVLASVFAIVVTFFVTRETEKEPKREKNVGDEMPGVQARYKLARQRVVKEKLTADQLLEEKQSESESLTAIYKLLKERKDMFPDATMDDIRDQLSLYKY